MPMDTKALATTITNLVKRALKEKDFDYSMVMNETMKTFMDKIKPRRGSSKSGSSKGFGKMGSPQSIVDGVLKNLRGN